MRQSRPSGDHDKKWYQSLDFPMIHGSSVLRSRHDCVNGSRPIFTKREATKSLQQVNFCIFVLNVPILIALYPDYMLIRIFSSQAEMPPRRCTRARGANQEALAAKSDRASSLAPKGRGYGRLKGRGHGRMTQRAEELAPADAILERVAKICKVHQAIENLVGMMANLRRVGEQP